MNINFKNSGNNRLGMTENIKIAIVFRHRFIKKGYYFDPNIHGVNL